jgi:hypothetical protein
MSTSKIPWDLILFVGVALWQYCSGFHLPAFSTLLGAFIGYYFVLRLVSQELTEADSKYQALDEELVTCEQLAHEQACKLIKYEALVRLQEARITELENYLNTEH